MKKIHLLCLAFAFVLFSCKKDDKEENGSFHVTCKIDGVSRSFNTTALAAIAQDDAEGFGIYGTSSSDENADRIILMIAGTDNNYTARTYTDQDEDAMIMGVYGEGGATEAYQAGTDLNAEAVLAGETIANHFKIVITSIDNNTVKGTFSGDVYLDAELDGSKKTITEGSFYVPIFRE